MLMEMFFSLILSTCDRFFAIKFPFKHSSVKRKHVVFLLSLTWILSIVFTISSLTIGVTQYHLAIVSTVLITLATIILSSSNLMVYFIAKRHQVFLKANARRNRNDDSTYDGKVMKASYACFAIVFSFVISWTPFVVHSIMALTHVYHPGSEKVFTLFVEQFALLNSLFDPVLMIVFSNDCQEVLMKLCRGRRAEVYNHSHDTTV